MFDRVLIKRDPAESTTSAGFIIPDSTAEKANKGTVVATGPGRVTKDGVLIPMTVKPGERIMFAPGHGIRVKVDGEELLVLIEDELLAVID
jgi:chaperonin GroES